ncbi:MAG: iron-containing alcohol dehydrogenase [Proteobacteria bacterium]|nr:iron-containing alcohol dehydrogenase [Pseudomonadota bacterium]
MSYWFEDPGIKALLPLATASGVRGLFNSFSTPTMLMGSNVFPEGPGLMPSTPEILARKCPKKRAFVVSDEFGKKFMDKISRFLTGAGFESEIWTKVELEAPLENVQECAEAMTKFEPDLIMAVGGGSVMDAAKGAWVIYERPDLKDLMAFNPLAPLNLRQKAIMAAVPTTAGTGSECTGAAVLHDHKAERKIPIASGELIPDFAILAPEFSMSMPPKLTVGSGLDVLAHAMDSVTCVAADEMTDAMGLASIQMTFKFLPRAYANGRDREARLKMLIAASVAGISFGQAGAALTHSFGHSVGSLFNIHHGLAVGLFIPFCLQFYSQTTDKHDDIARALRVEGKDSAESLTNLIRTIRTLYKELDVPLSLKDLGIPQDKFQKEMERLVLYSVEDIDTFFSPRPLTNAQCEKIMNYAYEGKDIDF